MKYNVIGLMSGSSLDGLDIAHVVFTVPNNNDITNIEFELVHNTCIPYSDYWLQQLKNCKTYPVTDFLELHTAYGRYLGMTVEKFIAENKLTNKIDLIASHGHTIHHNPKKFTSFQLGEGAQIAAITGIPTVSDLRNMDVALGGQGAPIVPIADKLLFNDHNLCLNIGGIANITVNQKAPLAFDICPANQILNYFANKQGLNFDNDGNLAKSGNIHYNIVNTLLNEAFIQSPYPKSLDNSYSSEKVIPILDSLSIIDALATGVDFISTCIANSILNFQFTTNSILITGGGAHNKYLIASLESKLSSINYSIKTIPPNIIDYKEAIAMALIGLLKKMNIPNVLNSVTGAQINSVGGSYWNRN